MPTYIVAGFAPSYLDFPRKAFSAKIASPSQHCYAQPPILRLVDLGPGSQPF